MFKRKNAALAKREMIQTYMRVFNTEDGKRVLHDLMKSSRFLGTTFDDNPHVTSFNEGQRALVTRILSTINVDPAQMEALLVAGQSED